MTLKVTEPKCEETEREGYEFTETPVKHTKYLISTHELITTGPSISIVKLSRVELHSMISEDSDKEDCLSIEDEI